jgi:hypothetical protein
MTPGTRGSQPDQAGEKLFGTLVLAYYYIGNTQAMFFIMLLKKIIQWISGNTYRTISHIQHPFPTTLLAYKAHKKYAILR